MVKKTRTRTAGFDCPGASSIEVAETRIATVDFSEGLDELALQVSGANVELATGYIEQKLPPAELREPAECSSHLADKRGRVRCKRHPPEVADENGARTKRGTFKERPTCRHSPPISPHTVVDTRYRERV